MIRIVINGSGLIGRTVLSAFLKEIYKRAYQSSRSIISVGQRSSNIVYNLRRSRDMGSSRCLWGVLACGIFGEAAFNGLGGVLFMAQLIGTITGVGIAMYGG
jgi:hypothetical protein